MKRLASYLLATFATLGFGLAQDKGSYKNIDAATAKLLVADKSKAIAVLDVRTPAEFKAGHLAGAKLVDFKADDFSTKLAKIDRDKTYLLHCRSGARSSAALKAMKALGFKSVYHLDGGILAWEKAGGVIEK